MGMSTMAESQGESEDLISLAKLKAQVRRLLPPKSIVRDLILSEKDLIPAHEARTKFEVYDKLLSMELQNLG